MSHTASTENTHVRQDAPAADRGADGVVLTEDGRVLNDPTHTELPGHGNTPGGWLMAGLVVLGVLAGAVGLLTDLDLLVWLGVALAVIGAVVGFIAAKMDHGRSAHHAH